MHPVPDRSGDDFDRIRPHLSDLALRVHTTGALASLGTDDAGLVTTHLLDAMAVDTTTAVAELEVTGMWRRDGDCYRIDPTELTRLLTIIDDQLTNLADDCARAGGHVVTAAQPGYCSRCMSAL